MASGRAIWITFQAVTMVFVSLVMIAAGVHVSNGDPGQAFENTIVAGVMAVVLVLGRRIEAVNQERGKARALIERFDAEVARELAEAEQWHAQQRRIAAREAKRIQNVGRAEEMAYAEEGARQAEKRVNRGFSHYQEVVDPRDEAKRRVAEQFAAETGLRGGDVTPERVLNAELRQMSEDFDNDPMVVDVVDNTLALVERQMTEQRRRLG